MSATLIDGRQVAARLAGELREEVADWIAAGHRRPALRVVLVGTDPASEVYVSAKERACEAVGIGFETLRLPPDIAPTRLKQVVEALNADDGVDGILVQLPLPAHIPLREVTGAVAPEKDVDGFHPLNAGRLIGGESGFRPCTPAAVMRLLKAYGVRTEGRHAVIVGASSIVGRPVSILLGDEADGGRATVTVCHRFTRELGRYTRSAEILVVAAGRPDLVDAKMVMEGAVVIDVGMNRVADPTARKGYTLRGDCCFESVREKAGLLTPVPGGVGPMTVAMLMRNTLLAAQSRMAAASGVGETHLGPAWVGVPTG